MLFNYNFIYLDLCWVTIPKLLVPCYSAGNSFVGLGALAQSCLGGELVRWNLPLENLFGTWCVCFVGNNGSKRLEQQLVWTLWSVDVL